MVDEFTLTLNSPITEEQWDAITDVDFDHTDRIFFHTKHGKDVEFVKVVRCRECKHNPKKEWFNCPMSHLSEKQKPDSAWCWKGGK